VDLIACARLEVGGAAEGGEDVVEGMRVLAYIGQSDWHM
jgi:hypothetical protein